MFIWFTQELDYKVNYMVLKITLSLNVEDLIPSVCGIINASDLDKKNKSIHKHLSPLTIINITRIIILFISSYINFAKNHYSQIPLHSERVIRRGPF